MSTNELAIAVNDQTIPVWFLDIDGVINSFGMPKHHMIESQGEYKRINITSEGVAYPIWWNPKIIDFINDVHRTGLAQIVWLTTWVSDARTEFAPRVGLDDFAHIQDMSGGEYSWNQDWWKWRRVREFLDSGETGRRVVWTDDDLSRKVKEAFWYRFDYEQTRSKLIMPQEIPGLRLKELAEIRELLEA